MTLSVLNILFGVANIALYATSPNASILALLVGGFGLYVGIRGIQLRINQSKE